MMQSTVWYIHPYAGGPSLGNSARPYYLAREWQKLGINATIFCSAWHHLMYKPEQHDGLEKIKEVPYLFVPSTSYRGNGLSRLKNMFLFCKNMWAQRTKYVQLAGKPSVIIASSPHPYSFIPAWFLARHFKAKLIFEVRDLWPLSLVEIAGLKKWHPLVWLTGCLERWAYRKADHVVSLLPNAFEHMHKLGLNAKRYQFIPNGINIDACTTNPINDHPILKKTKMLLENGSFVVIYPGALGPPNNMLPLVEAAALLQAQGHQNIQIVVMGSGGEQELIAEQINKLALRNFHLFPSAERNIALTLMSLASAGYVSVRPLAIYRYGISFNKLFEYMQMQLPIVFAADVPNNPVMQADCGIITSPNNAEEIAASLLQLASSTTTDRQAMGERGARYALEHHDYAKLAFKYYSIF